MQPAEQTPPQASVPHAKNKIIRRRALEARKIEGSKKSRTLQENPSPLIDVKLTCIILS